MTRDPRKVKVQPIEHPKGCRSYVVIDPASREAVVIDPLLDRVSETLRVLADEGAKLQWIVDTHSHADHLSGAALLHERTGCDVIMHPSAASDVATHRAADGETLLLGDLPFVLHHAPGNTPDGIVVEVPGALFTGDTLLIGTVGLQDAPGADPRKLFDTLHRLFDDRPEVTVIHPGHDDMGRSLTTIKQERTGNAWLREDDYDAFVRRFAQDDRATCEDGAQILDANRQGLTRVPRDLATVGGLQDPAHATESALRRQAAWGDGGATSSAGTDGPIGALLLIGGAVVVAATLLGWLLTPVLHALAAVVGAVFIGLGLRPTSGRRRRREGPSLFYEGPQRKGIGE